MKKIRDIGEQGLLKIVQKYCPQDIIGDDGAIIKTTPEQLLVITTDLLIEGVHFSDRTTSPYHIGYRSATANLSDLAAMGATPLGITVGLGINQDLSVNFVEEIYQGLVGCLSQYETPILGGDIVRSPIITLAITAFGEVEFNHTIKRATSQKGDVILITGFHGLSKAGLQLLLHPELNHNLTQEQQNFFKKAHQQPQPRLDILPILKNENIRISGMDSSDGLADAIIQICQMSGVGAKIDINLIPIPPGFENWLTKEQILNWILYGGEDFELVLTLPETNAKNIINQIGNNAAIIGYITAETEIILTDNTSKYSPIILNRNQTFQHFKP